MDVELPWSEELQQKGAATMRFSVTGNEGELEVGVIEAETAEQALDVAGKILGYGNHAGVVAFGREEHGEDWTLTATEVE